MKNFRSSSPFIPFCRQGWRIPAAVLVFFFFGTIAWGIHLVRDHRDQLNSPLFGLANTPKTATASGHLVALNTTTPPDTNPVRVALVNIAGQTKPRNNTPAGFISSGSGVLVNPKGYVVTAFHLIENLSEIQVRVQTPFGPREYSAKTVKVVREHDLALVKIVSQDVFPYMALDDSPLIRPGAEVQAWGDPLGTEAIARVGTIEQVDLTRPVPIMEQNLTHLIQTNAIFHWAQSGGPLINDQGNLVGINLAVEAANGTIVGYAVPVNVLITHFQEVVTFSRTTGIPATNGQPAFASEPAPQSAPRPPRMADRWWQKVQGMLAGDFGKNIALQTPTNPSSTRSPGMGDPGHTPSLRILGYTPQNFFGLLLLGFVSGISGGMMTMGGGIIKVTGLMWFFGYGLLLVRPVAYITNIFMYGAAVLRYRRQGLLRFDLCKPLIPWAMGGMVLGYFIGNVMSKTAIQWLLGVFALLLGIKMLVEISESRSEPEEWSEETMSENTPRFREGMMPWLRKYFGNQIDTDSPAPEFKHPITRHGILGLPMGIISGILGITGGVIEVPLQRYIAHMPLRNAIANSATLVFFASLVGSVVALWHGVQTGSFDLQTPLVMALILTPGAFLGGMAGAWMTSVIPLNMLRWIYAVLMFVIAVRMFMI
ncbi:MAG: TSUP family transporter [Magnetococcales bacterium]|nr:TSUP family transporter [Magnetococcales bacterium]